MEDIKINVQSAAMLYINQNIENVRDIFPPEESQKIKVEDIALLESEKSKMNIMA